MKMSCLVGAAVVLFGACTATSLAQPSEFDTSLHATRAGKDFWYSASNGGFEQFTNIPIEDLGCKSCHGPTDADGNPYDEPYEPGCGDCHQQFPGGPVAQDQCLSCHGRQKTEIMALGYSDVHRDAGFVCWDCHTDTDVHGDGTPYDSMLRPNAISANCEQCHNPLPMEHVSYDPHDGALHCTACHAQTVISCYNCHFESQVEAHVKRAKQPLHDFVMLVNREEDDKIYSASFQSITYEGNAFVAFAPFTPHSITRENARDCTDCHVNFGGQNEAILEYNTTGRILFADWDDDANVLSWKHGIVPLPVDYDCRFQMDFITYDGDPSTPPSPTDPNWSSIGKFTWDGSQLFFGSPLTREQMAAIGFVRFCPTDTDLDGMTGFSDLLAILSRWGQDGCPEDIDEDGLIGFSDLLEVLSNWGPC